MINKNNMFLHNASDFYMYITFRYCVLSHDDIMSSKPLVDNEREVQSLRCSIVSERYRETL